MRSGEEFEELTIVNVGTVSQKDKPNNLPRFESPQASGSATPKPGSRNFAQKV